MRQAFDERNRDIMVSVGGRLSHRDEARVSPFDSAVQGGDAVWEGLRLYDGRIFRLEDHLKRLRRSAHALAFEQIPSAEDITAEIRRTLEANGMRDNVHIRLTLTRGVKVTSGMDPRLNQSGPTLIVLAEHKSPVYDPGGITLVTSSLRRAAADSMDPKIHHNNMITSILAKVEANVAGADDALLLDPSGFVAETNATNVFLVDDDVVLTPTTRACPEGITRATVIELCAEQDRVLRIGDWTLTHVYNADEMFVTGTMGGLTPVTTVDGRQIGTGKLGPVTESLRAAYADLTSRSGTPV